MAKREGRSYKVEMSLPKCFTGGPTAAAARWRVALIAPLGLALLNGCALAPPDRLAANRQWQNARSGYVFAISYFTAGELSDPRWEKKRLEMMKQAIFCKTGEKIVRRDVRWFPANPVSRKRCAAVIYMVECDVPTLVPTDNLSEIRQSMLSDPFEFPIERNCGQKDRFKREGQQAS